MSSQVEDAVGRIGCMIASELVVEAVGAIVGFVPPGAKDWA